MCSFDDADDDQSEVNLDFSIFDKPDLGCTPATVIKYDRYPVDTGMEIEDCDEMKVDLESCGITSNRV